MAYEIINSGPVTPHRLHAVIRLVYRLEKVAREDLINYVQPLELGLENQSTAADVIMAAINCRLLTDSGSRKTIRIHPDLPSLENFTDFRSWMQSVLLGKTKDTEPNFLLNIFSAWYFVQDERIFGYSKDVDKRFNNEVFPKDTERSFNSTKLNSWKAWASFLGFGWFNPVNGVLVPDVHDRIEPQLEVLLPGGKQEMTFGDFIHNLAGACPELDGGFLFKRCWQFSRQSEGSRNRLSLGLSTALRVLNEEKKIKLIKRADASENWQLYPASGYELDRVTHVRLGTKRA